MTQFGLPEAFERGARANPIPTRYPLHSRRKPRPGEVAHFADAWTDPEYLYSEVARSAGYRAIVVIPLMREGELVGVFGLGRPEPEPFTESQIKLTQTFADQAAIAIENARLFGEVQAKTRDLEEALERQTATSEILRVISQSPTDARPVFERIVLTAVRVLKCDFAGTGIVDGDSYWVAASATAEGLRAHFDPPFRIRIDEKANFPSRAIFDKTTLQVPDWSLIDVPPHERVVQEQLGAKSALYLPLIRESESVGVLVLVGNRPNSFGPKEIAQAESFRDQAMIAIENARLFAEVQAKTRDVEEALEDQIATSGVLQAIGASMADAQPVFDRIVDSLANLMPHDLIGVWLTPGDGLDAGRRSPRHAGLRFRGDLSRARRPDGARRRRRFRTAVRACRRARRPRGAADDARAIAERHGNFAVLITRMVWKGRLIGTLGVTRAPDATFTARERKLLRTFADQAVIAIENARLFGEVQAKTRDVEESLAQQTATADVLKAISRTAFDLDTVLETLISTAVRLCDAKSRPDFPPTRGRLSLCGEPYDRRSGLS